MIMRIVVVLPDPFGPSNPSIVPRGMSRSKSETAVCAPNDLVTPDSRTAVSLTYRLSAEGSEVIGQPLAGTIGERKCSESAGRRLCHARGGGGRGVGCVGTRDLDLSRTDSHLHHMHVLPEAPWAPMRSSRRFRWGAGSLSTQARGRLWVVCRSCERWNLTPLEERWEAVEACEKLFRDTRMRMSSENVGLARHPEGLELVRIGKPLRAEFAAWRYGDQFGRRRRHSIVRWTAASVGLAGGVAVAGVVGGAVGALLAFEGAYWVNLLNYVRPSIRFRPEDGAAQADERPWPP